MAGQCTHIKRDGERCRGAAAGPNSLCWAHDPANAEKRRRTASRAGKSKANRELRELKDSTKILAARVLSGEVDRADAAVVGQLHNTIIRAVGMEMKMREVEDLERRLDELEEVIEASSGKEGRWGPRAG